MLTKKILQELEEKLIDEKEKLEKKLKSFAKQNPHNKDDYDAKFPDFGDTEEESVNEVAEYSDNLSLERTLEKELQDAKSAIARIKRGAYGKCKYCKKEIDIKRLMARPSSSACIDCKKKLTQEV